jgi:hypothetical protein
MHAKPKPSKQSTPPLPPYDLRGHLSFPHLGDLQLKRAAVVGAEAR